MCLLFTQPFSSISSHIQLKCLLQVSLTSFFVKMLYSSSAGELKISLICILTVGIFTPTISRACGVTESCKAKQHSQELELVWDLDPSKCWQGKGVVTCSFSHTQQLHTAFLHFLSSFLLRGKTWGQHTCTGLPLGFRSVARSWPTAAAFVGRIIPKVNSEMEKSTSQCEIELFNPSDIQILSEDHHNPGEWVKLGRTWNSTQLPQFTLRLPSGTNLTAIPLQKAFPSYLTPNQKHLHRPLAAQQISDQRETTPKKIF